MPPQSLQETPGSFLFGMKLIQGRRVAQSKVSTPECSSPKNMVPRAKIALFSKCQSAPAKLLTSLKNMERHFLPTYFSVTVENLAAHTVPGTGAMVDRREDTFVVSDVVFVLIRCCWSGGRAVGRVKTVSIVIVFFPFLNAMNSGLQT